MSQSSPRHKVLYYSALNVAACLAVVFLHVNGCFWEGPATPGWFSSNIIETFFYWAVPIFFMLTGATLMDYRQRMDSRAYAKRRIRRTVVPYVVWSLIATVWVIHKGEATGWRDVISNLFVPNFMAVYWFFIPLFGIYLSIPVLSTIKPRERLFNYLIAAFLVFQSALPLVCSILGVKYDAASITPAGAAGYVAYALIGYQLANHEFGSRQRAAIYACGLAGWLVQLIGTYVLSSPEVGVDVTWKGYTNLPAVAQAIAVFVLFKYADRRIEPKLGERARGAVFSLAKVTFGVYLIHLYWVSYIPWWFGIDTHSLVWRLVGPFLVFGISAGITAVIRKIPVLREIVGG